MVSEEAETYFVLLMQKNAAMQKVACDKMCAMTIVCTAIKWQSLSIDACDILFLIYTL